MKREITLCGIPYIVESREGMTVFRENSGIYGCKASIVFEKDCLHYVKIEASSSKGVPFCHLEAAHNIMESLTGPNHFDSREEEIKFNRRTWWERFWKSLRHPAKAIRWWWMLRGIESKKINPWCVECGRDLDKPVADNLCPRCREWWEKNSPPAI